MIGKLTIALAVAGASIAPLSGGPAADAAPTSDTTIPHCLVGTWSDRYVSQDVLFQNHLVVVSGKGGDVDHIHANGIDRNDWAASRALHGEIDGSPVTEVVRGVNRVQFTKGGQRRTLGVTELGWSAGNSATFTYQGQTSTQDNQESGVGSDYYRCTATRLTWLTSYGSVIGREKRISRTP